MFLRFKSEVDAECRFKNLFQNLLYCRFFGKTSNVFLEGNREDLNLIILDNNIELLTLRLILLKS